MTLFTMGPALLFCPADRSDRYDKAAERSDAVILDLEDAVAPDAKAAARRALAEHPLDAARTIVRVNPAESRDFAEDLAALRDTAYRTVMVAKAERSEALEPLGGFDVIALCETAAGVLAAPQLAAAESVTGLMWGAEDLVASLGGSSSRGAAGAYRAVALHARTSVLLAAGAYGKAAIDAIHLDLADAEGLAEEAADAVASGFSATACIHPSQVEVIRKAYRPSDDELEWARQVLQAAQAERGVFRFKGRMVDAPVLRHAERLLARSG